MTPRRMPGRPGWPVAIAVATAACCAAGAVQAGVTTLYDESVSGDLSPSSPPSFVLQYGLSAVSGSVDTHVGAQSSFDNDQFRFTVASGFQLVGVSVSYQVDATRGSGTSVVGHLLRNLTTFDQLYEKIIGGASATYAGNEALFDAGGAFTPIAGGSGSYDMQIFFDSVGGPPETSYRDRYTLIFDVQPNADATALPEPAALSLASAALLACGVATKRRSIARRRRARQRR